MNKDISVQKDRAATILLVGNEGCEEITALLADSGYQCCTVSNSREALERLSEVEAPDVLLLLSDADGLRILPGLRNRADCYLPVIAVVDQADSDLPERYQESGVDVVLNKPVNSRLLLMNVRFALRLHRSDAHFRQQMATYREQLSLEQEVAATIYKNVLQSHLLNTEVVKAAMPPMSLFSGDLLLVERTPHNHLHVLLGDFSCHGLAASVVASPAASIFYGMSRKGFSIVEIIREINSKLHKMLPINQSLAATAVVLYPETKNLGLVSCGLPNQILVNALDGRYQIITPKNIPLGVYSSIELEEQQFAVTQDHRLYLMADGVVDAENSNGEPLGMERVIDALCQQSISGFEALKRRLAEHTQHLPQNEDDISFIELCCDVDNVPWQSTSSEAVEFRVQALTWKTAMEFDIDALRQLNPVPVMVNALMEIQGLQAHRQSVFLIVSELFANAFDHGVLGLDSATKSTPEGFMRFYELKEERMQCFQQGKIRLLFAHKPTEQGGRLTITVADSGDGFNWQAKFQELEQNTGFSGRGLKLLESLCTRVTFHGKGNRVTAVFDWQN